MTAARNGGRALAAAPLVVPGPVPVSGMPPGPAAGPPSPSRSRSPSPRRADLGPDRLRRIGAAASETGVSERTLRYYEEIGLLSPAAHSQGGCREYGPAQLERVRKVRELQELMGLNLEEIKAILDREDRSDALRRAWNATEDPEARSAILSEAITSARALRAQIFAKRARIEDFLGELDARLERLEDLLASLPLGTGT